MKCPNCKGIGTRVEQYHNSKDKKTTAGCIQWWKHVTKGSCGYSSWGTKLACTEQCRKKPERTN